MSQGVTVAEQFVVVYFRDFSLVANVVGPFRSHERAHAARRRIEDATEHLEANAAPQVVELEPVSEAVGDWILPEPEPHDLPPTNGERDAR
jgi:hypothetical protein